MEVFYSSQFKKQYKVLPKKVRNQFKKRLEMFFDDQINPQLHIHKLRGRYNGLHSMNVTGDVRALFDVSYKNSVLFVTIGTHSTLYD